MVANLPQPAERPAPRLISRKLYEAMIDKGILTKYDHVELINGFIFEKMPTGSRHNGVVNRLNHLCALLGDRAVVSVKNSIALNDYSQPEPDVALLKPRADFYSKSNPQPHEVLLVIEVADSSLAYDRTAKIPLFAAADIPEAWLVDVNDGCVTLFSQPDGAKYLSAKEYRAGDLIPLACFPGESLAVSDLGL